MESEFQFSNPALTSMEYKINNEFSVDNDQEVKIAINMSVRVEKSDIVEEAKVELIFEIGDKSSHSPFYIVAVESADFKWKCGIEDAVVDKLLQQNAPALLLSYLRPIIVQITSASPFDTYNIPFINFAKHG